MAKVDVIEERLNNHITFARWVIGTVLAILAFMAVELYRINGHLGELDGLKEKVATAALQTQAAQPQSAFDNSLASLRSTITMARKDRISVPSPVVEELRTKLLASNSQAPDFWPTLSEFVSYRSSLSYQTAITSTWPTGHVNTYSFKRFPDCIDSLPKPMRVKEVLSPTQLVNNPGLYENCRFVLDSPKQDQALNVILRGNTPLITFRNCLIEYHGGEINLILAWDKEPFTGTLVGTGPKDPSKVFPITLSGPAIQFENCLFVLEFQNSPPPNGQRLSTTLLAESASSVSLPVSP